MFSCDIGLLRQASGFERLVSPGKDLEPHRLTVTHRPEVCRPSFHICSASQRPCALNEKHDYLVVALEEGFRLDAHRIERAEEVLEGAPRGFNAANRLHIQPSAGRLQLEVAMRETEY